MYSPSLPICITAAILVSSVESTSCVRVRISTSPRSAAAKTLAAPSVPVMRPEIVAPPENRISLRSTSPGTSSIAAPCWRMRFVSLPVVMFTEPLPARSPSKRNVPSALSGRAHVSLPPSDSIATVAVAFPRSTPSAITCPSSVAVPARNSKFTVRVSPATSSTIKLRLRQIAPSDWNPAFTDAAPSGSPSKRKCPFSSLACPPPPPLPWQETLTQHPPRGSPPAVTVPAMEAPLLSRKRTGAERAAESGTVAGAKDA